MAEGGHPTSELCPPGGTVSSDAELSAEPLLTISRSSVDTLTSTRRAQTSEPPHPICQEDLKEATGEGSNTNPVPRSTAENDDNSQPVGREPAMPVAAQVSPRSVSEHQPERGATARTSDRPRSVAEPYAFSHPHEEVVRVTNQCPRAGGGTAERLLPASLPVQRSHSDTVHIVRDASVPQPPHSETCVTAYHGGDLSTQEARGQSMQLQHCNTVTTVCRGGNSGHDTPMPQAQGGCLHICMPGPANTSMEGGVEAHHDPQYEEAVCYGSYVHHGNLEDTFAAYCHPQSIPAPAQLLPRLAGMEVDCRDQRQLPPHLSAGLLTLPRLISSVSETGLDAKRMLHCCNLNCSWVGALPPGGGPQLHHQRIGEEFCSGTSSSSSKTSTTRDMGTMTAHRELRNIGVQTSQTSLETARIHPPPHMFPQICLVEENGNGTNGDQNVTMEGDGPPKAPVKEVKWDAEGMTWEVYGASVDPEELGLAIQKHLEMQIRETASRAVKLTRQDTNTSRHSDACRRKRGGVMGSIRTPACCVRSTTAVD